MAGRGIAKTERQSGRVPRWTQDADRRFVRSDGGAVGGISEPIMAHASCRSVFLGHGPSVCSGGPYTTTLCALWRGCELASSTVLYPFHSPSTHLGCLLIHVSPVPRQAQIVSGEFGAVGAACMVMAQILMTDSRPFVRRAPVMVR